MTEYTPTTKEVRLSASGYRAPITPEDFDRWLAAHDAEVRAGADVPDWEYGVAWESETPAVRGSREVCGHLIASHRGSVPGVLVRRRAAGTWAAASQ